MNDCKIKVLNLDELEISISRVHVVVEGNGKFTPNEFMQLYTSVYNIQDENSYDLPRQYEDCSHLYMIYHKCVNEYIKTVVVPSLEQKHDVFLLKEIITKWSNIKVIVKWLARVFKPLGRFFIPRYELVPLDEAGLVCFRDQVYNDLKSSAMAAVITLIEKEREGEQIERSLLKDVTDLFVGMGMGSMDVYERDFQEDMLNHTSSYYRKKAADWFFKYSLSDYLSKVEECLDKEKKIVSYSLHSSSEEILLKKVQDELLVAYSNELLESEDHGMHSFLTNNKVGDISRIYRLFQRIPKGLEAVANIFTKHVRSELFQHEECVIDVSKVKNVAGTFVGKLIELYDKYHSYVIHCFSNDTLLDTVLKEALEGILNKRVAGSLGAEHLASYSDDVLKKGGSQELTEEAVEEALTKVVILLHYITDKDLFKESYRKKLSSRLLLNNGASDFHEKFIIEMLKLQFNAELTKEMELMIKDLELAKKTQNHNDFKEYLRDNEANNPGIEMTVTVLTQALWPSFDFSDFYIPTEMVIGAGVFKEFYRTKEKHRKLTWVHSRGTCVIQGNFDEQSIEMSMTAYQASVLLLFNNEVKMTYSDIKNHLNLGDEILGGLLSSLSCSKHKVLVKIPDQCNSNNDSFEFNSEFNCKGAKKIKITLPAEEEKKKKVSEDATNRPYIIIACLMRIVKTRKFLTYKELVDDCKFQLRYRFEPTRVQLKKEFDRLIDQGYIKRDFENIQYLTD